MKKIYLLISVAIICISNNSSVYSCSNNYKSRNAFYNYDVDKYNSVTQSDLDEVDNFINDFLLGNTIPTTNYYFPYNNLTNNTSGNRKLSYNKKNNKRIKLDYQTNTYNNKLNSRQISLNNNKKITPNNTYTVLQNTKKQNINIVPIGQNVNNKTLLYNPTSKAMPNILNNNQITSNIIETNCDLTSSEMKSILTDSEIKRLVNNNKKNNKRLNNAYQNNSQQDGMKELSRLFTKDEIKTLFPNYTGTTQTVIINDTNEKNQTMNNLSNHCNLLNNNTNTINKKQKKIIKLPVNTKKTKESKINNTKKKLNISLLKIDNNVNNVQYKACLTDRDKKIKCNEKPKIDIRKAIIRMSNKNNNKVKLLNKKTVLRQATANSIITNWENGITQDEVVLFLNNIQNSNAFENAKMQIYSLLGDITPSFGNTDKIKLLFDVIKYNNNSHNEKHIYNYEKPLAIAGTFIDYYLNNIDLYNNDREQFNISCVKEAANIISYDTDEYSCAVDIFYYNSFTNVINKIVKGVNLIEEFKNNKNEEEVKIIPLNLDKGKKQDWLTTTVQLFDYALQYSDKNDAIKNTNFAKFTNYLKNKSKYRNINEEIQLIPTLKSFVKLNKENFNSSEIKSALEALYNEENSDIACYGIMGSIIMFRIFPELKTIFSSNQFGTNDSIIDISNKFHFSSNQSFAKQFNNQAYQLLDIAYYDNGRKLFRNTDYLIMITNGLTRNKIINDRKYISRYNTENIIDSKKGISDVGDRLELYELIGVQLYSNKNVNYISIDKSKFEDAINSQSTLGELCINKNLQPIQALYKRIPQKSIV